VLDAISFCPHRPDEGCSCRKPQPGLLIRMMREFAATPDETIVIGDSLRDIEAGRSVRCRCILVRTGNGRASEPAARASGTSEVFDDLRSAVDAILAESPCS
jgi:histidinol phosphatase-like enzyme